MEAFAGPSERLPAGVRFRPEADSDLAFLGELYASTRREELEQVTHWTDAQKRRFLQMQFEAQHKYYREQFPSADFLIVEWGDERVGRVYIDRRADEIRLIDIAMLPEHRGRGLGSAMLEDLLDEARHLRRPVRIHVEKHNPAMRLYRRLGFVPVADRGVYDLLESGNL